jgi:16S rRNA G1207 methylase RsmC
MEANPGASLLDTAGGRYILAHEDDKGEPVKAAALDAPAQRTAARLVLRELTEPTAAEVSQQIATSHAQRERREAAAAEAAPFAAMREALRTGQAVQVVSAPQLFPTPAHVAARMVELADVQPGERVLEPSAGTGALLAALGRRPWGSDVKFGRVHAVEIHGALCPRLRADFPLTAIHQADFLTMSADDFGGLFDVVLMNPPFANADDVKHIMHARRFLAPGGRIVAICAAGPRQHDNLQALADSWEYLPPGTFDGTNVRTVLLTMGAAL